MANAINQQAESGHLVRIMARTGQGSKAVGWARTAAMPQDFGTEAAHVIGSIMPQEHVPQRWQGSITLDSFRIRRNDLRKCGLAAYGEEVLMMELIDLEVLDRVSGDVCKVFERCTLASYNYNVTANAFSGESVTFQALNVRGPAGSPLAVV